MNTRVLCLLVTLLVVASSDALAQLLEATPEEAGLDSRRLVEMSRFLREQKADVRSLLVARRGKLVFERYSQGVTREHNHAIYSVTKSVSSTLIGILVAQGRLPGPDVPILAVLPADIGSGEKKLAGKRTIRLRDAMRMASGLRWTEHPVNTPLYRAPDRLAVALQQPMAHAPGEVFNYSNADAEMVGAVIHARSGSDGLRFAEKHLFAPLGIRNYDWWYPDARGRYPGGWAMRLRAIDMARLGQLYLQDGVWDGKRILPEGWVAAATSPGAVDYYGYFWWLGTLDRGGRYREYAARGWKGQFVVVVPELELVVTMTSVLADETDGPLMSRLLETYLVPAARRSRKPRPPDAEAAAALREELAVAARTRGRPGQPVNEQDTPQR